MATIVNNPGNAESGAIAGLVTSVVVVGALALIALFVWPGVGAGGVTNVNVEAPALDSGGVVAE